MGDSLSRPAVTEIRLGPVTIWRGAALGKYPDGNQLRVEGRDSTAVLDTTLVSLEIEAQLADADLVILGHVHEDHMVGIGRFADRPLYVHEADVRAARSWEGLAAHYGYEASALEPLRQKVEEVFRFAGRSDAIAYADGARWELGGVSIEAIHLPGHTAGHCGLLIEPGGIAFIGDIDLSSFGPYYGDACSNLKAFRSSLRRIADLPAKVWITSHHKGVIDSRERFLDQLAAYGARIDAREARLMHLLASTPASIEELAAAGVMYRPGTVTEGWMMCAEQRCIAQHLVEMLTAGRVREIEPGRYLAR